jgi:pyruvate kinase
MMKVMKRRTKIICTIGPAVQGLEKILQLIDAGMNVARINFSHGTQEEHLQTIRTLKQARQMRAIPLGIMLDTKGPEIRVAELENGQISLKAKQKILLVRENVSGNEGGFSITPAFVLDHLEEGMRVLFDDGYLISIVLEKSEKGVLIELQNAGLLKSHKGVNVPGADIPLPAMTEQDVEDLSFGCEQEVDLIAASFIRSADHVLEIKKLLHDRGKPDIPVMAKIENSLGVQNFDTILQVADGIMIARGDLGVELPLNQVPSLQKMMIRKCVQASKPVVTATQMLESMIRNPRPTRAEVSDVANAIYDTTSAVMLSGETAIGLYPIETVKMMAGIVEEAENAFDYRGFFDREAKSDYHDVSSSVALASVRTAYSAGAQALFVFTSSGFTARAISRFRPKMPIIALTPYPRIYHQLSFHWGVIPVDPKEAKNIDHALAIVSCFALKKKFVHYGDLVIITAGAPFGVSGTTNMMIVESIGDVIVRGMPGEGERVHGKVALILTTEEQHRRSYQDEILVLARCDDTFLPLIKGAKGIILQNHPEDSDSEKHAFLLAKTLRISLIVRADEAFNLLKEGQLVTLDPERGLVYKGDIGTDEEMIHQLCSS